MSAHIFNKLICEIRISFNKVLTCGICVLIVSKLLANEGVELLHIKFTSRPSYPINQAPYKRIAFAGINGDKLQKINRWLLQKLELVPDLQLVRPNKSNPAVNELLNIQGHTLNGLKKLENLLNVQALLQGALEMYYRENLEVDFELHFYDLSTGIRVNTISQNWTIPVKSSSRQVLYETVFEKIVEEIKSEWYSYQKTEKAPWFHDAHQNASNILLLLKANQVDKAFSLMVSEKRKVERDLFNQKQNRDVKAKYQTILYHFGLLYELRNHYSKARQFYDLATKHGQHSKHNVFRKALRRVQHRW